MGLIESLFIYGGDLMNINWYPGHMKKTRETIAKSLSLVDIVFELIDARIPYSSRNPVIDDIVKNKPRILILNKMDLADPKFNKIWKDHFQEQNITTILFNSLDKKNIRTLIDTANSMVEKNRQTYKQKGIINKPVRAMILGIPNVGKSTLINNLSGRKGARTGNVPGVTRGNQWIKTRSNMELLDTPGILWPKFEDKDVGLSLAFIGSIKDDLLDMETLALRLIERLMIKEDKKLEERYKISVSNKTALQVMEDIALKRGCIIRGGEIDYTKVSNIILDEFRKGTIGRITLELPETGE